ncbi:DUF4113 domain-containing protein [Salmonella enterica]|nr:DUF4113 domain-containing protein [Salmonella enterica]EEK2864820.1 DUF4113 domain-containing protein [Salmonella enterica]EEK2973662.1 DUF4113 domain-containing protein [Salmonella enterica]
MPLPDATVWGRTDITPGNIRRTGKLLSLQPEEEIWVDGHSYAKAGCILNDFTSTEVLQLNLSDEGKLQKRSKPLMKVLDGINHSGLGKIWFAGRGIGPEWKMKREMPSPAYKTRWSDLASARIR